MSVRVSSRVWDSSKASHGALIVLLAMADWSDDNGGSLWPSVQTLADKTRLEIRGVQRAIRRLVNLGELEVMAQTGPSGCNRYRIIMDPVQNDTPVKMTPRQKVPRGVSFSPEPPTKTPPVDVNKNTLTRTRKEAGVETAVVFELAAKFTDATPLSNGYKTRGVIAKALGAGHEPASIARALEELIEQGRGCSEDTLRIALAPRPASKAQVRSAAHRALLAEFTQRQPSIGS